MKGQPSKASNNERRNRLIKLLAPAMQNIERAQIRRAPYAISPEIPDAQQNALIDHALELGGPPGPVIARKIATTEGHTVEVLVGWERLEAFVHKDAYPHSPNIPLGLIECNNSDAAFYAIEYAAQDQKAAGLVTSPLLYAAAAQTAIEHFSKPDQRWKIQTLANALCINRTTLSNRLRLLKGLQPRTRELLQQGLLTQWDAKTLLAEPSPERQERLAAQASKGMMSTRTLYELVHPDYERPKKVANPRGQKKHRLGDLGLMERALSESFGTPTTIALDGGHQKGYVEMPFHSLSELKGLLEKLDRQIETDPLLRGTLTMKVDNKRETNALLLELGANTDPQLD
ncbi:ParB/RepB/Spo0J family partition protein [Pseudohalioglobus lutimaris]|nr:hypothetical protein [Pseudohalioglobus lutimaris]